MAEKKWPRYFFGFPSSEQQLNDIYFSLFLTTPSLSHSLSLSYSDIYICKSNMFEKKNKNKITNKRSFLKICIIIL